MAKAIGERLSDAGGTVETTRFHRREGLAAIAIRFCHGVAYAGFDPARNPVAELGGPPILGGLAPGKAAI
jgi:hypothetical protein